MMKRLFAILLSLAMLLSVTAVFAEGDAEAAVPDTLLLTVNGQEIRENNEKLQHYLSELLSGSEETDELFMHVARMFAMNYTLQEIMLLERATANGPVDEEALRQQAETNWNNSVEQIMANLSGITEDSSEEDRIAARADALSYIESNYGYTEESFVAEMVQNMPLNTAYTDILNELKTTRTDLTATEEDILAAYNDVVKEEMESVGNDIQMYEFYQQYYGYTFHYVPEGYRGILHILLKVDQELLDQETYEDKLRWCDEHHDIIASAYVFSKECLNFYVAANAFNPMFIDRKIRINCLNPGNTDTGLKSDFGKYTSVTGNEAEGLDMIEEIFIRPWNGYWASPEQMGYPLVCMGRKSLPNWTHFSSEYKVPEGVKSIRLLFWSFKTNVGSVYLDNLSLQPR